jgi:hypothetical protein
MHKVSAGTARNVQKSWRAIVWYSQLYQALPHLLRFAGIVFAVVDQLLVLAPIPRSWHAHLCIGC